MIALFIIFNLVIFMMHLTIVGFGNQAKAWAMNLKDSKFPIKVALRKNSNSLSQVLSSGLNCVEIGSDEFYQSPNIALLIPDEEHDKFLELHASNFKAGTSVIYAHGFSLIKNQLNQKHGHLNHILLAPKTIGSELRNQYLIQGKLGAVYSLEYAHSDQNLSLFDWLLHLSMSLGINLGPYRTTFKNETQADLFSEQAILCSLIPFVADHIFKKMIEHKIEPELAYLECWHELKLIINAMIEKGPQDFFNLISPNALIGAKKGYDTLMREELKNNLDALFTDIQNGIFFHEIESKSVQAVRNEFKFFWENSPLQITHQKIQSGP